MALCWTCLDPWAHHAVCTETRPCWSGSRPTTSQRAWDAVCGYLRSDYFQFAVQLAVGTVPITTLTLARCSSLLRAH